MINATGIAVAQGLGTACDTFFSQVQLIVLSVTYGLLTPEISRTTAIAIVLMIAIVFCWVNRNCNIMIYIVQYKNRNHPRTHVRNCSIYRKYTFTTRLFVHTEGKRTCKNENVFNFSHCIISKIVLQALVGVYQKHVLNKEKRKCF